MGTAHETSHGDQIKETKNKEISHCNQSLPVNNFGRLDSRVCDYLKIFFAVCFKGSGSNVDLCVITKEGTQYLRPYDVANAKGVRQGRYSYKRGTTGQWRNNISNSNSI